MRIEYELNGKKQIYIVDFVDHTNRIVTEIKPRELCVGEKFNAKIAALDKWAANFAYTALIVDKKWLQEQTTEIDYNRFDTNTAKKIKALYETNKKN